MSDPSAVNQNITIDDFDSVITYADQSEWSTPDPSKIISFNQSSTPWREGTYHLTSVVNASFTFNFEGPMIFVYGAAGPGYGSFEVSVDGDSNVFSAYASQNASSYLLFRDKSLTYSNHTLKVTNLGARDGDNGGNQLLFDYLDASVQLAPAGASISNTTVQETDSRLTFNGNWTTNVYNPNFSGGGSKYTQADGASVSLSFYGSAIYVFGDKTDRHGLFTVTLDDRAAEQFNGVSGCGGAFAHACEKDGTLAYIASNLNSSLHTVTVRNIAGVNNSFFDLDCMTYTTPSEYAVRGLSLKTSGGVSPSIIVPGMNALSLLVLGTLWLGLNIFVGDDIAQ